MLYGLGRIIQCAFMLMIHMYSFLCCGAGKVSHVRLTGPECEAGTCTFSQDAYVNVQSAVRCAHACALKALVPRHLGSEREV